MPSRCFSVCVGKREGERNSDPDATTTTSGFYAHNNIVVVVRYLLFVIALSLSLIGRIDSILSSFQFIKVALSFGHNTNLSIFNNQDNPTNPFPFFSSPTTTTSTMADYAKRPEITISTMVRTNEQLVLWTIRRVVFSNELIMMNEGTELSARRPSRDEQRKRSSTSLCDPFSPSYVSRPHLIMFEVRGQRIHSFAGRSTIILSTNG